MVSYATPKNRGPLTPCKKYCRLDTPPPSPAQARRPIMMMKHNDDFSPLTEFKKGEYRHFPKIPIPREVDTYGNIVLNLEMEFVLNW